MPSIQLLSGKTILFKLQTITSPCISSSLFELCVLLVNRISFYTKLKQEHLLLHQKRAGCAKQKQITGLISFVSLSYSLSFIPKKTQKTTTKKHKGSICYKPMSWWENPSYPYLSIRCWYSSPLWWAKRLQLLLRQIKLLNKENFYIAFENLKLIRFYVTEMLIRFVAANRSQSLADFSIK